MREDAFFGSPTKVMLAATSPAVSALPSPHVTFLRSVNVAEVGVACHLSASPATMAPFSSTLTSESYRKRSACSADDSEVKCGSRVPGSDPSTMVNVLPLTKVGPLVVLAGSLPQAARPSVSTPTAATVRADFIEPPGEG